MDYAGIIKQIKSVIYVPLEKSLGISECLISIISDYGNIDMELFAKVLAIRTKPYEIKSGMMCDTIWTYVLTTGLSGHKERRKMFFDIENTNMKRRSRNILKRRIYYISLSQAFHNVRASNYFTLAKTLRRSLFKAYRPNEDKLTYLGGVLHEMLTMRAKILLTQLVRRHRK